MLCVWYCEQHHAVSVYVVLWRTPSSISLCGTVNNTMLYVLYCEQHQAVSVCVVLWEIPCFMCGVVKTPCCISLCGIVKTPSCISLCGTVNNNMLYVWFCEQHQAVSGCVVLWEIPCFMCGVVKTPSCIVCVVLWTTPCFMCGIVNHTDLCLVWFVLQQVMCLIVWLLALATVEVPSPLSHTQPLCKWWNHYTEWLDKQQLFEDTLRAGLWEDRCLWMSYMTCFWRL